MAEVVVNDQPLMQRLRAEAGNIADAMADAIVDEIGAYRDLDDAELAILRDEVRSIVNESLTLIAEGRSYTEDDLAVFMSRGERRALTRFPISEFMRAHAVGAVVAQRKFWEIATDHDWTEVLPASGWIGTQVPRAIKAGAIGYASARGLAGHADLARQMIAKHLLEGKPTDELALAAEVSVATSYGVLVCPLPSEDCLSPHYQQVWQAMAAVPDALPRLTPNEAVFLLPLDDNCTTAPRTTAGRLITALAGLIGQSLPAGFAFQPGLRSVPLAAGHARGLCRLLRAMPDARSRLYSAADLVLERSIADNSALANELGQLLDPLHGRVGLTDTLEKLIACDLDRESTAAELHIHRRTLSYRLSKIAELTNVDPRTVHGISLLRAAIIAARLTDARLGDARQPAVSG